MGRKSKKGGLRKSARLAGNAASKTAKLGAKASWAGIKKGAELGVKTVETGAEAVAEGVRNANPIKDIGRVYGAGKNICRG